MLSILCQFAPCYDNVVAGSSSIVGCPMIVLSFPYNDVSFWGASEKVFCICILSFFSDIRMSRGQQNEEFAPSIMHNWKFFLQLENLLLILKWSYTTFAYCRSSSLPCNWQGSTWNVFQLNLKLWAELRRNQTESFYFCKVSVLLFVFTR